MNKESMTPLHIGENELLIVRVPEGSGKPFITGIHGDPDLIVPDGQGGCKWLGMLPAGEWEILGNGILITEEVAKGIVGKFHDNDGWPGYYNYMDECKTLWNKATESLHSLIRREGYEPENCVILKRKP